MSSRTPWTTKKLPSKVPERYSGQMVQQMRELVESGRLEWRISGSTQLHVRPIGQGTPCVLTLGPTAKDPVYAAKWRSALRRWGLDTP